METQTPVTDHLISTIRKRIGKYGIVVWYDPNKTFRMVARETVDENTKFAEFTGSYYRLRHEIELLMAQESPPRLLIYLPDDPLPKLMDVMLGPAKAGIVFQESLRTIARAALKDLIPKAALDELLKNDVVTLEELDKIGATGAGVDASIISVIFGTASPHEVTAKYLCYEELENAVDSKNSFPDLIRFLRVSLGLEVEDVASHEELKRKLCRHVLMTEFLAGLKHEVSKLKYISLPKLRTQLDACVHTASYLRELSWAQETYTRLAQQVEADFHLPDLSLTSESLGEAMTFPFEESTLLSSLGSFALAGDFEKAFDTIAQGRSSFWAKTDPTRAIKWQMGETAVRLLQEGRRIQGELKKRRRSAESLFKSYTEEYEGEGGWYILDQLQRHLERFASSLGEGFELEVLAAARGEYEIVLQEMGRIFSSQLVESGFQLKNVPVQSTVFGSKVAPYLNEEKIALFMVDALRFEMAKELADGLSQAEDIQLEAYLGTIPSITKFGMAALLPGAEKGMGLVTPSGKVGVEIGETVLKDSSDRMKFLKAKMADTFNEITLGDLLLRHTKTLKKRFDRKKLVVVRSQEIDALGEGDYSLQAHRYMTEVLGDIRRGLKKLSDLGFKRFFITTDHGFIMRDGLEDAMKVDPPGGDTVELHRRCWIGRGGTSSESFYRLKTSDLGMGGDLELAFPKGIAFFKVAGGALNYFHGGISLQELAIPLIVVETVELIDKGEGDYFDLKMTKDRVTSRIFTVSVKYTKGKLISKETRRVRVVGMFNKEEIAEAATAVYGFDDTTKEIVLEAGKENHVTLMIEGELLKGEMSVQLVDSDTYVVLAKTGFIPCDLSI
ncbi:MAG: PglZ domain-containing protein [Candidatus Hodarchaeota archaeon]